MADSCYGVNLSLMCDNWLSRYKFGKLKLPTPFLCEYGDVLPKKFQLEIPNGDIWNCLFVKDSQYLEGLKEMMDFYGVKPYYLVLLHYSGGSQMMVQIFNECAVEISYPSRLYGNNSQVHTRQKFPLFQSKGAHCTQEEVDKLGATLMYNAMLNNCESHELIVKPNYLNSDYKYEVLSKKDCEKMKLKKGLKSLTLVLDNFFWTIGLFWNKNGLSFGHKWFEFLRDARAMPGDICVFFPSDSEATYQVAVLPRKLLDSFSGSRGVNKDLQLSFYKILNSTCISSGELELPAIIYYNIGTELGPEVVLHAANGKDFSAYFSYSKKSFCGLNKLFRKLWAYAECVIFFKYVGHSKFVVNIYDSLGMELLKHISGAFIKDEDLTIDSDIEVIDISDEIEGSEGEGVGIESALDARLTFSQDLSNFSEGRDNEMEVHLDNNVNLEFTLKLLSCNVDNKCHGVYIPRGFQKSSGEWSVADRIIFRTSKGEWKIGLVFSNGRPRFSKGWSKFVRENGLLINSQVQFRLVEEEDGSLVFDINSQV